MVPGRAVCAEPDLPGSAEDQPPGELDRAATGVQCRLIGAGAHPGVGIELGATAARDVGDRLDLGARVHASERLQRDRRGADPLIPEPVVFSEQRIDRLDPPDALRVHAGVVTE